MSETVLPNHLIHFSETSLLKLPTSLYKSCKAYLSYDDIKKIQKAYSFAFYAHSGQKRKDGSDYITHPVAVTEILLDLRMDPDSVCSALMHDVLEDCNVQKNNLAKIFGDDVAHIVDGVSKLGKIETKNISDNDANNLQKMALAMANDVRVILVKLCDRLHNMRTIEHVPRNKQILKAKETLELYGPLALRVGMQDIRAELEDLSFRCIHPMRAKMLENAVKTSSGGRKRIVTKIRKELKTRLKSNNIQDVAVKGREKNLYSIYSKIKTKHKPFSEILDVYGFRILVDSVDDCYRALGIIHNYFSPIENKFKDYIAIPKTNGYQALHTSLLALEAFPIEVQIQTRSMWATANMGIAAHWGYKTDDQSKGTELRANKWLSGLVDLQKKSSNPSEFADSLKKDLDSEEVYLFSPKGHIYALKAGATPIDFAYEVHTGLGNSIIGCKVNRREAPLNVELESGQTVEIITSSSSVEADPSWLNFIVTSKARSGIRARLRNQKTSSARKAGKFMLESELQRSGKSLEDYRGSTLKRVLDSIGVTSLNKLLIELGSGKRTGNIVAERFYSGLKIRKDSDNKKIKPVFISDNHIEGVSVVFAKCCHPIYQDPAIAHSDTERGIVIHHNKCKQVAPFISKDPRYIPAKWTTNTKNHVYTAKINIVTVDEIGVLAEIVSVFTKAAINIEQVHTKNIDSTFSAFEMEVDVESREELQYIMQKIRSKKITSSCTRLINEK
ncbi:bifunctional (p)ppGpp synthetase/guanosine-3',5'-bis(diphosphate) 3'-pyrophosphohydrolase [Gammaproteobacteria bacterium]|nr:bifunctional (p)ppGpp synthetase/guanosine-3',5'-bis(diphosphate) 3'-pyrophosphohydrolase [Gammaproteobacteria bacterium]MDA9575179.1 bifunctional (p)ppGpp synthetase/guanosine-3',5'-bis(diphosphate) 3'-pyrophosphohydrolase [Gammaproteobacteria bacterium]MDB2451536.1 bifunctional (p)ppGpp synthetase/guanosine-3',5'-bis(diphosphate) 3'-pyrophosphohydrolase [Gammaproteobacteria bacterium]MDC3375502.1 bifunctional (p)ppGpp synthetase/guanosine-3',5'-bis(diphosphate) 3'-pyrophosphohydrolase [Gamm